MIVTKYELEFFSEKLQLSHVAVFKFQCAIRAKDIETGEKEGCMRACVCVCKRERERES